MKKDLFSIAYVITAIVLAGTVAYYIFFVQKDIIGSFNDDSAYVKISARQEMYGQRIAKAAVGMGYSETERNFRIFQAELARIVPEWRKMNAALIEGDADLDISRPSTTPEYAKRLEDLRFFYDEMNTTAA